MTNQEKQKLNEKLARWAGFEWWSIHLQGDLTNESIWEPLSGVEVSINDNEGDMPFLRKLEKGKWHPAPDFTDSLDACFKWLVPKLYDLVLSMSDMGTGVLWCSEVALQSNKSKYEAGYDVKPALALCLAIEKLI